MNTTIAKHKPFVLVLLVLFTMVSDVKCENIDAVDGKNPTCSTSSTTCAITCGSQKCENAQIHCPSGSGCEVCNVECDCEGCQEAFLYTYECDDVTIGPTSSSCNNEMEGIVIYAPKNGGNLIVNTLSGGSNSFQNGQIHTSKSSPSGSISVTCESGTNQCLSALINATYAESATFTCLSGSNCGNSNFWCPDTSATDGSDCLFDCSSASTSGCSNANVYARQGIPQDVTWTCRDGADYCSGSKVNCDLDGNGDYNDQCSLTYNGGWSCDGGCNIEATPAPTGSESDSPTSSPIDTPSPTNTPTQLPSNNPTKQPSNDPTKKPTIQTVTPTSTTRSPSDVPIPAPTPAPTNIPTDTPTDNPTTTTSEPTQTPTDNPTTHLPTGNPSKTPTNAPTKVPTDLPTTSPINESTFSPSDYPTDSPSRAPSNNPTLQPSNYPSPIPSNSQTISPSLSTLQPSKFPTDNPTFTPAPTLEPSDNPTAIQVDTSTVGTRTDDNDNNNGNDAPEGTDNSDDAIISQGGNSMMIVYIIVPIILLGVCGIGICLFLKQKAKRDKEKSIAIKKAFKKKINK